MSRRRSQNSHLQHNCGEHAQESNSLMWTPPIDRQYQFSAGNNGPFQPGAGCSPLSQAWPTDPSSIPTLNEVWVSQTTMYNNAVPSSSGSQHSLNNANSTKILPLFSSTSSSHAHDNFDGTSYSHSADARVSSENTFPGQSFDYGSNGPDIVPIFTQPNARRDEADETPSKTPAERLVGFGPPTKVNCKANALQYNLHLIRLLCLIYPTFLKISEMVIRMAPATSDAEKVRMFYEIQEMCGACDSKVFAVQKHGREIDDAGVVEMLESLYR
ncbi:hypothetical protein SISNIDRAFT_487447 [Sistotremastrum niveocremeum HHB9708]|uniref:Uncharacterized protein n=1 Tax=Sistotremastrum niveocremeum HHB9708 TaxID=1314777 RepID=A0A164SH36_9AGAM|nr:hypothetical protein SISNIDRAFT_487447 [Sistotremastrum niveocremeum HHB9708]